jgi:hypothetical protein
VVELAAIETKVLLVDALRPAVPVAGDNVPGKPIAGIDRKCILIRSIHSLL